MDNHNSGHYNSGDYNGSHSAGAEAMKQPSKLACEIERQFAEAKLIGPMRRLGDIVDEVLSSRLLGAATRALHDLESSENLHACDNAEGHSLF